MPSPFWHFNFCFHSSQCLFVMLPFFLVFVDEIISNWEDWQKDKKCWPNIQILHKILREMGSLEMWEIWEWIWTINLNEFQSPSVEGLCRVPSRTESDKMRANELSKQQRRTTTILASVVLFFGLAWLPHSVLTMLIEYDIQLLQWGGTNYLYLFSLISHRFPPPIYFWIYFWNFQCGNDHKCGKSNSLCLVESNIQGNVPQDRKSTSTSTKNARSSQPIEQSIIKQSIKIETKFSSNKFIGGRSIDCPNE